MDTGSFIVYIKTEDIYTYIVKDVETRFETSNYELPITYYIPLPIGKKSKKKKNYINESWIKWKNNDRVCFFETKKPKLFNRRQR